MGSPPTLFRKVSTCCSHPTCRPCRRRMYPAIARKARSACLRPPACQRISARKSTAPRRNSYDVVVKVLEARSFRVDNAGPDGLAEMIAAEPEKWARVIRAASIRGD